MEVVIPSGSRREPLLGLIVRRQRPRVVGAALCLIGHQSCEALVPVAIGIAIDEAVASGSVPRLLLSLVGLAVLFAVLTTCYRWFARLGQGAVIDEGHTLRTELAARVLGPGAGRRKHGEVLTIASSDADQAASSIICLAGVVGASAALVVSCGVLLTIDLRLGAVLIGTAALATFALNAISRPISRRVEEQQQGLAGASAVAVDLMAGLRVLHGLGAQEEAAARYRAVSRTAEIAGVRAGVAKSVTQGATVLAGTIVLAVSVTLAGLLAVDGQISIGAFVSAVGAAQFISEPLTTIGLYLQVGAAARASARRVREALTEEPVAREHGAAARPRDDLHLDVAPGEFVGIVADHGALERIASAVATSAEGRTHVEPHRVDLFAGSIEENLFLGRRDADPSAALGAAGAREFVDAQPAGLAEPLRERGLSLSGGQRQRLALARALHADPEVLVLIDPTTAVDSMTEKTIADGIRTLRHGSDRRPRTTVVLTSSPVLLARTDRVILVGGDGAPTYGAHHELLGTHDGYRRRVLG